jgi:hypothetical protein
MHFIHDFSVDNEFPVMGTEPKTVLIVVGIIGVNRTSAERGVAVVDTRPCRSGIGAVVA